MGRSVSGENGAGISRLASTGFEGDGAACAFGAGNDSGLDEGQTAVAGAVRMSIKILTSAVEDLMDGDVVVVWRMLDLRRDPDRNRQALQAGSNK